jgi:hypothetical protein
MSLALAVAGRVSEGRWCMGRFSRGIRSLMSDLLGICLNADKIRPSGLQAAVENRAADSRFGVSLRRGPWSCGLVFGFFHRLPMPRQQFRQARDRQVRDPGDDVDEPCLRVDPVQFGGADGRVPVDGVRCLGRSL